MSSDSSDIRKSPAEQELLNSIKESGGKDAPASSGKPGDKKAAPTASTASPAATGKPGDKKAAPSASTASPAASGKPGDKKAAPTASTASPAASGKPGDKKAAPTASTASPAASGKPGDKKAAPSGSTPSPVPDAGPDAKPQDKKPKPAAEEPAKREGALRAKEQSQQAVPTKVERPVAAEVPPAGRAKPFRPPKAGHEEMPTKVDKAMARLRAGDSLAGSSTGSVDGSDREPEPLPPVPDAEPDAMLTLDEADVVEVEELPEGRSDTKPPGQGEDKDVPPEAPEPYRALKTSQVFGRFQLLMEMGQGGMATLYLARIQGPEKFEKLVAIKKIHPHLAREPEFINMFLDEARIAALIHDPHVVTIFDLGQIEGAYFIAMEYIHGQNLTDILRAAVRRQDALPWPHAVRIVADAAAGLHAAHELRSAEGKPLGVVHRDVSPQNIIVSYEGHVKVVDFGIAFAAEKLSHTGAGILKGKAAYMSPEQTMGASVDRRSDIFSLGTVLWESVCLRRLFRAENEAATLLKVRNAEVPRPRTVRSDLPIGLEKIVMKALAQDPDNRLSTAGELAEQLEELLMRAGEVITPQKLAKLMGRMFHERKKIKDKQIQQAMQQNLLPAMQGVGMVSSSSTSMEMPRIDSAEIAQPPRPKRSLAMTLAAGALFMAGAVILVVFLVNRPGFLRSKERASDTGPMAGANTNVGMSEPAPPGPPAEPQRPSRVVVKVSVKPENAPVVVTFRGKEHKGSMFRVMIPYSTEAETIEVQAEGYLPQNLVVVPTGDSDIPVTLKKAPAPARPMAPVRRPVRRTRKLLKDFPE